MCAGAIFRRMNRRPRAVSWERESHLIRTHIKLIVDVHGVSFDSYI